MIIRQMQRRRLQKVVVCLHLVVKRENNVVHSGREALVRRFRPGNAETSHFVLKNKLDYYYYY